MHRNQQTAASDAKRLLIGPAVPAKPSAELLAETYLFIGEVDKAISQFQAALKIYVNRARSVKGLAAATERLQKVTAK